MSYFNYLIEIDVWFTSFDQSSEIPLHAEGCVDVIDDEVVSLSYSYTVAIYVKDSRNITWITLAYTLLHKRLVHLLSFYLPV